MISVANASTDRISICSDSGEQRRVSTDEDHCDDKGTGEDQCHPSIHVCIHSFNVIPIYSQF